MQTACHTGAAGRIWLGKHLTKAHRARNAAAITGIQPRSAGFYLSGAARKSRFPAEKQAISTSILPRVREESTLLLRLPRGQNTPSPSLSVQSPVQTKMPRREVPPGR